MEKRDFVKRSEIALHIKEIVNDLTTDKTTTVAEVTSAVCDKLNVKYSGNLKKNIRKYVRELIDSDIIEAVKKDHPLYQNKYWEIKGII